MFKVAFALILLALSCGSVWAGDTTLQSLSPFPFGASINTTLLKNNPTHRAVVAREYNSLTPENAMKMGTIHPGIATYNWTNADTLVNFAQQYNKRVHGHTLIWHQSLPGWVTGFNGDSAAWEGLFKTHIQTVVSHYAGTVASWDVVNEAFNDNGTLRSSIWLQHLGAEYIARAFQYAHEADPAALLFYNDYGHEYSTAKLNAIDSLLRNFLQRGIPVHGAGLQMHMNKNTANSSIANAIRVMALTGLRVHISELDIALNPEGNSNLTFTPALSQVQADKYNFIVRLYKNLPAAQRHGITTWDVSDADTWITTTYNRPDWPLPFDTLYQKKAAYGAITEGFTSTWNYDASGGQSASGSYTDLGTNGNAITTNYTGGAMTFDNDNSAVQNIGFSFSYNGSVYQQFVLNSNGFIKLGAVTPSSLSLFYPAYNGNTNGIITAVEADLLYPYNHDLTGTAATEYRVYTTGSPGSKVCTIQYKAVADKLAPAQYANMNFQVKLYEGSNIIEFVYDAWLPSANTSTLITGAVGIKGSYSNTSVNLAKGSANSWAGLLSTANGIYYINGDYATAGPQFNTRNTVLPDAGRTFRFTTLSVPSPLPVTLLRFSAVDAGTTVVLKWLTEKEVNTKNYEVQRSADGIHYVTMDIIPAAGINNTATNSYSYTDNGIGGWTGTIYYRLKQNDQDGRSKFTPVIAVRHNNSLKALTLNTQNPFNNAVNVGITSGSAGKVILYLLYADGTLLVKKEVAVERGTTFILLNHVAYLPKGVYVLRAVKGNEVSVLKVLKE